MHLDSLPKIDIQLGAPLPPNVLERRYYEVVTTRYLDALERVLYVQMTTTARRVFMHCVKLAARDSRGFTRAQLAAALGRARGRLLTYDIALLESFVGAGLLSVYKRGKPVKPNGSVGGYELRYTLPDNVKAGGRIVAARRRAAAVESLPAAAAPAAPAAAAPLTLESMLESVPAAPLPRVLNRLFGRGGG